MNLYGYIIFVPYCSECSPTRNTRILDVGTGHCPRHYDGFSRLHASARGSGTISVAYAAHTEAQQPTSQLSLARLVGRSSRPRDQGQRRRDLPPRTLHRSVGRGAARGHGVAGTGGREPLRGSRQPCAVVRCERVRSRPQTCPISTEGWTRRVHFVREGGGGGNLAARREQAGAHAPALHPLAPHARHARAVGAQGPVCACRTLLSRQREHLELVPLERARASGGSVIRLQQHKRCRGANGTGEGFISTFRGHAAAGHARGEGGTCSCSAAQWSTSRAAARPSGRGAGARRRGAEEGRRGRVGWGGDLCRGRARPGGGGAWRRSR